MALNIFKKKGKTMKDGTIDRKMSVPSAPPVYTETPGPFDAWGSANIEELNKVSYLVDTCLSVTTRGPLQSVADAYMIAQGMLDHYNGPVLSRPFFMALFLGGIHGMQAGTRGAQSIRYEREFHGPMMFPYHKSNPVDWSPKSVSIHYASSLRGKGVEVVFEARLQATRQTGPSVWHYLDGLKGIQRPSNEIVLKQFCVPTIMLGTNLAFNLDVPLSDFH
ncbi:matrix [Leman virus]|uniref:Matrix protein n=1 Tax=Leman virus TaxID=3071226 RepID=A0AAE6XMP4_9RHAB|nr:matrix [Perhabdovirus perca]QIQ19247.1 matrix [Leman virus]